jgi:hypothetical protein
MCHLMEQSFFLIKKIKNKKIHHRQLKHGARVIFLCMNRRDLNNKTNIIYNTNILPLFHYVDVTLSIYHLFFFFLTRVDLRVD